MVVHPGTHFYGEVTEDTAAEILEAHLEGRGPVTARLLPDAAWDR
jgi:(2Fe-2S) ferredoxin